MSVLRFVWSRTRLWISEDLGNNGRFPSYERYSRWSSVWNEERRLSRRRPLEYQGNCIRWFLFLMHASWHGIESRRLQRISDIWYTNRQTNRSLLMDYRWWGRRPKEQFQQFHQPRSLGQLSLDCRARRSGWVGYICWFHQLLQPYSTVRRWDNEIEF